MKYEVIEAVLELSEKRMRYGKIHPTCSKCGTRQVQLVDWFNNPVWKCRHCKFSWETDERGNIDG